MLLDVGHPLRELLDGHGRDLGDVLAADAELQRLLLEPRASADRTLAVDEELLAPLLAALRILVLRAADVLGDALPRNQMVAARRGELRQVDREWLGVAVEDGVEPLLGDALHGVVEREVVAAAQHLEDGEEHVVAVFAQRLDGPLPERERAVGDNLPQVEDRLLAQSVAMGAGPLGRVEREGMGGGVLEGDARRGAHQVA